MGNGNAYWYEGLAVSETKNLVLYHTVWKGLLYSTKLHSTTSPRIIQIVILEQSHLEVNLLLFNQSNNENKCTENTANMDQGIYLDSWSKLRPGQQKWEF